ncbi:MAG: hypothetical protein AAFQ41_05615 [Cyanobacteria bacterium J06623_7]
MQILTKKQVKYCRLVKQRLEEFEYCLGINFQNKLFVSDKFFAHDRQQQAIAYCQTKYLAAGGEVSYILLANIAGLTIWREDKMAMIVGEQSIDNFLSNLELVSLPIQIQNIMQVALQAYPQDTTVGELIDRLKVSLWEIVGLNQQVQNGC